MNEKEISRPSKIKIGDNYGFWIVLRKIKSKNNKDAWFECLCGKCAAKKEIVAFSLLNGSSKSCGCDESFKYSGPRKGVEERRKKINHLLRKGYSQTEIMKQVSTSSKTICQERKKINSLPIKKDSHEI